MNATNVMLIAKLQMIIANAIFVKIVFFYPIINVTHATIIAKLAKIMLSIV
jgi:hypothetical protein